MYGGRPLTMKAIYLAIIAVLFVLSITIGNAIDIGEDESCAWHNHVWCEEGE